MQRNLEADVILGIGANAEIVGAVKRALEGEKLCSFREGQASLKRRAVLTTLPFYAYLKIAEGCDNRCTYCAIPMIRGRFRSRPMEEIVKEAEGLAAGGVKELVVVAQDTTRYGEDLYGSLMLPELLRRLCGIDGFAWIRVLYCYPERITDELLDVMASEEKIAKYIDIPLQHANGQVLRRMNRSGDAQSLTALMRKIRQRVPGITLRTTLIAGFPGETKEQFAELASFVKEVEFDRLGCFAYSVEEGTPAAALLEHLREKAPGRDHHGRPVRHYAPQKRGACRPCDDGACRGV
ncbi:MAG: MiaB/RimO family radical SAM methylthiotransferase [Oscillospiraceae bacterium]